MLHYFSTRLQLRIRWIALRNGYEKRQPHIRHQLDNAGEKVTVPVQKSPADAPSGRFQLPCASQPRGGVICTRTDRNHPPGRRPRASCLSKDWRCAARQRDPRDTARVPPRRAPGRRVFHHSGESPPRRRRCWTCHWGRTVQPPTSKRPPCSLWPT